jgi:hypothetical protein
MLAKSFGLKIAGTIFGMVALLHLLRLVLSVPVFISGWPLPMWMNVIGFIAATLFSLWLWKLAGTKEG